MKAFNKAVLITIFGAAASIASVAAHAEHLTAQQCSNYPFVQTAQPLSHDQVMKELAELEADGYDPTADSNSYPDDIQTAEQRLHQDFLRDCGSAAGAHTAMN